jgi:hypothetical protein
MKTKTCSRCGEEREYFEFHSNKSKPDGLASWCKVCTYNYNLKGWVINFERSEIRRYLPIFLDNLQTERNPWYLEDNKPVDLWKII